MVYLLLKGIQNYVLFSICLWSVFLPMDANGLALGEGGDFHDKC